MGSMEKDPKLGATSSRAHIELHMSKLNPPSRVVWLYMLQHDISHTLVEIEMKDQTAELVGKFPHREVPLLCDGSVVVFEAPAILNFLAAKYTNYAGYGFNLETRLLVESILSWANSELHRVVGYTYAYPSFLQKYSLPNPKSNDDLCEHGIRFMTQHLETIENGYLRTSRFLAGDRLTVADLYVATVLVQAEWVHFKFSMWPRIDAWLRKVKESENWSLVHTVHNDLVQQAEEASFEFDE